MSDEGGESSGGSPGDSVEISVMSASDLTLSDQTLSPPPEAEEGAGIGEEEPTKPDKNEQQDNGDATSSQPQDNEGITSLPEDVEDTFVQGNEGTPSDSQDDKEATQDSKVHPPDGETPPQTTYAQDNKETASSLQQDNQDITSKEDEWQDILGNGQLMKKVMRAGAGISTRPSQQSRVKVRTRGFLESGDVIDKHSGYWFTVGDGDVVQAWDIAVTLMECEEVARVKAAARFAYGERGKGSTIPPNSTITYELELLEVLEPVNFGSMTEGELAKIVERKKTRGNELYQEQEYVKATHSYQKGLQAIQSYLEQHSLTANIPPNLMEMQIRCLNNIAAAQLKLKQYREALSACERVLEAENDNVKALYRAGRVLLHLGEMEEAIVRLKKALSLQPQDKTIENELKRAVKKKEQTLQKEKEMYRRMVGTEPKLKSSSSKPPNSTWGPWPYMAVAGVTAAIAMGVAYFFTQRH